MTGTLEIKGCCSRAPGPNLGLELPRQACRVPGARLTPGGSALGLASLSRAPKKSNNHFNNNNKDTEAYTAPCGSGVSPVLLITSTMRTYLAESLAQSITARASQCGGFSGGRARALGLMDFSSCGVRAQ